MAVSNQDSTQAEELTKMLSQVAMTKTKPDADLPYLIQLESMILGKLREPFLQQQQQAFGQTAAPQPGPQRRPGPQMLPSPGGMGVASAPGPGGVNGVMGMPALPPIDEIRRMLGSKTNK